MGCASSRKQGDLEAVLKEQEEKAGLGKIPSTKVDYVLRKHSVGLSISEEGFEAAMKELGVSIKNEWNANYKTFFDSFFVSHSYSLPSSLVSLILLSSSSPLSKLELLFEVLDPACSNRISADSLRRLLLAMLKTAVTGFPLLVRWDCVLEAETVKAYLGELEERVTKAMNVLSVRILAGREEIGLKEFLSVVGSHAFPNIASLRGLREFVQSVSPKHHTRYHSLP